MSSLIRSLGVDQLSEAEQVQLAEEILESLGADREPPPISEATDSPEDNSAGSCFAWASSPRTRSSHLA